MKTSEFFQFMCIVWSTFIAILSVVFLFVGLIVAIFVPWVWALWAVDLFLVCPLFIFICVRLLDKIY